MEVSDDEVDVDDEGDGEESSSEGEHDDETVSLLPRRFPRSKMQFLIDEAEDRAREIRHLPKEEVDDTPKIPGSLSKEEGGSRLASGENRNLSDLKISTNRLIPFAHRRVSASNVDLLSAIIYDVQQDRVSATDCRRG